MRSMTEKRGASLTSGPLMRQILTFSLPLIASNLLQVLFNMSDIAVVGQFAGPNAMGSVGSTTTMVTLFTGLLIGIGSGVNALTARHAGAGDVDRVRRTVQNALVVCFFYGLLIGAAGLAGARGLLLLLGTKEELLEGAVLYIRIYLLGMPALALYNFGNGVLSAVGDTKRPLYCLFFAGVLNVGLNLLFVIVFSMGVAGVAVASIVSQYVSAGLILFLLLREKGMVGLRLLGLRLSGEYVRPVLALGVPAGLQNAIFAVANLFIQAAVNTFDTVIVDGNSAAMNADALVYDVMQAFYVACTSFMAQNYGAGKRKRIMKSYYLTLLFSFASALVMGVALFFCGRPFLSIFTTHPEVIDAGMLRLSIMSFSYCVSAFMDCTIAASRGLGKTAIPTVIVILGSCVFRVAWVKTVFVYFHTIPSLYLLYVVSWTLTAIAEILYFRHVSHQTLSALPE
ncbi:mATE efflux family protein [Clostridium sp. CAG:448]|nr:mATE efflux family protein [Clostridium sp. CAG:448]